MKKGDIITVQMVYKGKLEPSPDTEVSERQATIQEVIEKIKEIPKKQFPLGERPWCVECVKRISKSLITELEQLQKGKTV